VRVLLGLGLAAAAAGPGRAQKLFIPMDDAQKDHLKAYGVVYGALQQGHRVYWCLNFRGGSFVCEPAQSVTLAARTQGVTLQRISTAQYRGELLQTIREHNMEKVTLEKAPRIAVYTPPGTLPWDDAVTMALTYADIPYDKVYDEKILGGELQAYDWLHLHHEDFTGQYNKFHRSFRHTAWYRTQRAQLQTLAQSLEFESVAALKKAVALKIRRYVEQGGFLFAMCCAPNTLDIALAALGTDIVARVYDGDPVDPQFAQKLDYGNCIAFEDFQVQPEPYAGYFGTIDVVKVNSPLRKEVRDFALFEFSAKLDPVPAMLTQNHRRTIEGFYGLATSFNKHVLKDDVIVLGYTPGTSRVKYLHGMRGKGMFAYLGGHDPEDVSHAVGDPPTDLSLHPHSPGYRLILNNVLFPAAQEKEKKT
jgi:hypothetical protein